MNKALFKILKAFSSYWAQKRKLELWLGLVPPRIWKWGGGEGDLMQSMVNWKWGKKVSNQHSVKIS